MTPAPRPSGEPDRLAALRELAVLDTQPEQAYDDITRIAAQICAAPIALISLIDDDRQWFKSRVGLDVGQTPRDQAFCAHAILDPGAVLVVEDASQDPRFANNPLVTGPWGFRFYAGVPLVTATGHALGTLCVIDRRPRSLTPVQLGGLRALARQAVAQFELRRVARTLARQRDELAGLCASLEDQVASTDRDLRRAERIQQSLLPRTVPVLAGCCIHALYRPGHIVGGDLFDVVFVDERHVAIVVSDAAGHGLSAALLSVLFRERLRLADDAGRPVAPGAALARANRELTGDPTPPGMFVTAMVGLLDLVSRELTLASAGHPPLLWLPTDGRIELLAPSGPALGLSGDARYEERRVRLGAGDRLLFYTDGALDLDPRAAGSPVALGAELLACGGGAGAVRALYDRLVAVNARVDRDDVTLLLVDLTAGSSSLLFPEDPAAALRVVPAVSPVAPPAEPAAASSTLRFGATGRSSFLVLSGRVTWLQADALLAAGLGVLAAGLSLVVDLGDCELLDSTTLGTLHELGTHFDARDGVWTLQRVPAHVRAAFGELGLDRVLAHVQDAPQPLPAVLTDVPIPPGDARRQRERLLRAHEALAALSERNQSTFADLLANLRAE